MGQRSQIYVRYNTYYNGNKKGLIANYYSWNYGERMISRARWGIEKIMATLPYTHYYESKSNVTQLSRIFDTNFDMHDYQISCDIKKEWEDWFKEDGDNFNEHCFKNQDNNDGKLFVDICDGIVKYAFLDQTANTDNIMDAEQYMKWNMGVEWKESEFISKDAVATCENNIKYVMDHAILMTEEELDEFMSYDYMEEYPTF